MPYSSSIFMSLRMVFLDPIPYSVKASTIFCFIVESGLFRTHWSIAFCLALNCRMSVMYRQYISTVEVYNYIICVSRM